MSKINEKNTREDFKKSSEKSSDLKGNKASNQKLDSKRPADTKKDVSSSFRKPEKNPKS